MVDLIYRRSDICSTGLLEDFSEPPQESNGTLNSAGHDYLVRVIGLISLSH
jgi:hypothetical protein